MMNKIIAGLREILAGAPASRVTIYDRPGPLSGDEFAGAIADYIADNYGHCALPSCRCLNSKRPWPGRGCPNWKPTKARDFRELGIELQAKREARP